MANLKNLVENIELPNIAESVDDEGLLKKLACQVIEDFNRDHQSMQDWAEGIEDGRELAKQEINCKSEPWDGAANFKSPAILEASRAFGDRAVTEIVRGKSLVKGTVIGRDPQGIKRKTVERVTEFMNWQINFEMEDWREIQECLVYELPATGTVFKKTYFDPIDKVNKSELIHFPDFAVNQATTTIDKAKSFTQIMDFSVNESIERINAGLWSDVELYPGESDGDDGSNEEEDTIDAVDNPQRFLEQHCWFDLDDDGYQEPYIVTVHEQTKQVVRIVARYDIEGVFVSESSGAVRRLSAEDSMDGVELVKIKPNQSITKYGFIKSTDGTFLDVGYYHLLGPLSKAINAVSNQLIDAGTLANLQGGFLARGFRKRMGSLRMRPGVFEPTDIPAIDLQNGIRPHAFKEPSVTLLNLRTGLEQTVAQMVVNLDLKGVLAPNAPATTTLALIQEAMLPSSAIMQRIIGAEGKEFKKLFMLNAKFADPMQYQIVLDDPEANFENDFNADLVNVMPTANPEMSSRMQRIQLADALMMRIEMIQFSGGDVRPLMELYFDALGAEDLKGQVYPTEEEMGEEQKARMQAQQEAQEDKERLIEIDIDQKERELARKEMETAADLSKVSAEIEKLESESLLNMEKAESEEVKNQISVYTSQLQGLRETIETIGRANERIQTAPAGGTAGIPAIPTGEQGGL